MSALRWIVAVALLAGGVPAWAQTSPAAASSVGAAEAPARAATALWAASGSPAVRPAVAPSGPSVADTASGAPILRGAGDGEALRPDTAAEGADTTRALRRRPVPLTVFGYYRLLGYGRNITEPYPNLDPFARAYSVGDGYREPMLSLNVLGRPSGRASFGTEIYVFAPYDGSGPETTDLSLNHGVNLYGTFRTEVGSFGVRAGGIHWYNLSPFTIGVYQVLDRFSIFERTPWEGVAGTARYESYFQTGQANPGDARWNFQAFQGLILDGRSLPGNVGFDVFWGKTQPNGGLPGGAADPAGAEPGDVPRYDGLAGDARALPSWISGGRVQRTMGALDVALNTIYSYRTLDSLAATRRAYQVHTAQLGTVAAGVRVSSELGASRFTSPTYDSKWGEALMVRAETPAALTRLPVDLQLYQVGRHFYNENGEIATGNHPQIQPAGACSVPAGAGSVGGLITQVNQLAHNRRGVNLNTVLEGGPARVAVGWGMAHELAPTTTEFSYVHRINGLALSRIYNPFPANATCATQFGPLGRQFSFFRGVFERVARTDVEPVTGLAVKRTYYHAVDLQAKLGGQILGRSAYLFYLASFGSANPTATIVPRDDDTYLFVQYHELDAYVELVRGLVFAGYVGIENARGGRFTEVDATSGRPRDQLATGVGLGLDWTVAPNAGLYLRHRWMDFEDRSFAVDRYAGRETTLELKIFF